MNPLPAHNAEPPKPAAVAAPASLDTLVSTAARYSNSNRRALTGHTRVYPWLLMASTAVAALFCLLYVTKPVIVQQVGPALSPVIPAISATQEPVSPSPPEVKAMPSARAPAAFEETNLQIQHILTAEAPGGHQVKIDLNVPVIYQSRNLRWTPTEVANARELLLRLGEYQENSQILRTQGSELLDAWNALVERSIPASTLRADSPTLLTNQSDAADAPRPAGLDTTELIQLKPAAK